jgi:predicted ATPase/DNA-binding SARP family transcriptional activator
LLRGCSGKGTTTRKRFFFIRPMADTTRLVLFYAQAMTLPAPRAPGEASSPLSPTLTLQLLGPAQIRLNEQPLRFAYDRVLALLIYLAVESQRVHRRSALAGLLWPDQPEHAARHNLSQALWSLRRALHETADDPLIVATRDSVQFNADRRPWCDVVAFRTMLHTSPEHAIALYHGEFLHESNIGGSAEFEAWVQLTREHLHQQACAALDRLSGAAQWSDAETACGYARRWAALDPFSEEAQRRAMTLLHRTGHRAAALLQFERCRDLLHTELGLAPDPATVALYEELRREPAAPPLQSTLSIPPTRLIDRAHELAALADMLDHPTQRLITLIGPGGVGKTRLALHAVQAHAERFADGVYVVSLAQVRDADLALSAIAQALHVVQHDDRSLEQIVHGAFASRHALLMLDNCEHLLPSIATLVASATSRAALRVSHEQCVAVVPLKLPSDEHAPDDALARSPAVKLFVDRAKAVRATVALDYRAIATICRRLDGLPLAIELAATHVRLLDPPDVLTRLAPRLSLLGGGPRDLPERQQTLRATIAWSYHLLRPCEQALLRRLAVFVGGWTVAAAEAVCADEPHTATIDGMRVLEGLNTLLDASLITEMNTHAVEPRCTMLETIREYALEQLVACHEAERSYARHAGWITTLADEAKTAIISAQGARWSARLLIEHDNLRAALRWALDAGEAETVLRVGRGVWRFWWRSGFAREGLQMLAAAIACTEQSDSSVRGEALHAAGVLAWSIGDHTQARHWLQQGLPLAQTADDWYTEAAIFIMLGILSRSAGEVTRARSYFEQSRMISATRHSHLATRFAVMGLAEVATRIGVLDEAAARYSECIMLNDAAGDAEGVAASKRRLANVYSLQGCNLAEAQQLCDDSMALCREVDDKQGISQTLLVLGHLHSLAGDHAQALAQYHACLRLRLRYERQENCAQVLEALALRFGHSGHVDQAIQVLSAAFQIRAAAHAPLTAFERARLDPHLAAWRAHRNDAVFEQLWQRGRTMTLEQAAQFALCVEDDQRVVHNGAVHA